MNSLFVCGVRGRSRTADQRTEWQRFVPHWPTSLTCRRTWCTSGCDGPIRYRESGADASMWLVESVGGDAADGVAWRPTSRGTAFATALNSEIVSRTPKAVARRAKRAGSSSSRSLTQKGGRPRADEAVTYNPVAPAGSPTPRSAVGSGRFASAQCPSHGTGIRSDQPPGQSRTAPRVVQGGAEPPSTSKRISSRSDWTRGVGGMRIYVDDDARRGRRSGAVLDSGLANKGERPAGTGARETDQPWRELALSMPAPGIVTSRKVHAHEVSPGTRASLREAAGALSDEPRSAQGPPFRVCACRIAYRGLRGRSTAIRPPARRGHDH